MKTKFFFLAVAAVALASCSNDETVEVNQGDAISFRPFVANVTRAADAHFNASGDQFKVTAFETGGVANTYFSDVVFQGDGTTFTSTTNKYYWPSGYNLDFWAYAPVSNDQITYVLKADDATNYYKKFTVTPSPTASDQVDLVYARTNDWGKAALQTGTAATHQIGSTYTGVTINFRHAESKVAIALLNSNSNLKFTVSNVVIGNVDGTGTFVFGETSTDGQDDANITSGWTPSGTTTAVYSQSISPYVVTGSGVQQGVDMILIPQTLSKQTVYGAATAYDYDTPANTPNSIFKGAYIAVDLKIQNNATGGDAAYIVGAASGAKEYVRAIWPLEANVWAPGYKYTYTVDLAGGGYYYENQDSSEDLDPILEGAEIKFVTVTVDNWDASGISVSGPTL